MTRLIIAVIATALISTAASATHPKPKCKPSTGPQMHSCTSDYTTGGGGGGRTALRQ